MEKPSRSTYTTLDFLEWQETKSLIVAPKFQRRSVWTTPARSYLIDTLIRGLPVPPLYLRVTQSGDKKRIIREVIDGQQRVAAVLDFVNEEYRLSSSLEAAWAGKWFSELTANQQDAVRQYEFICEVLHGASDRQVLEMFSRLNTFSVKLNAQELRNGRYFGHFKQSAYRLAYEHVEFWRRNRIFTEIQMARMREVELTSELMIVQLDGLQNKKTSINQFYSDYDSKFTQRKTVETRFRSVLDMINEAFEGGLEETEFRRPPLFYSLYCAVHHRVYGLPKQQLKTPKKRLSEPDRDRLFDAVHELSEVVERAREEEPVPRRLTQFVNACLRQTDNVRPRQTRLSELYRAAF